MSVAIIVDTFPRWSERFIARELNELQRRGLDFTIFCLKAGDSDCERDLEFAGLIARRVVLPSFFLPSFVRELGMDDAAKERMKLVEKELGLTAFRQIGCANSLTKLIREHRHKIVYAHFASLPSTLGWLAAEALKLPFVMSCHARDVFVEPQLLEIKIECARRFFVCNSSALDHLQEYWFCRTEADKLVLMHHGLPLEQYPYVERQKRLDRPKNITLLAAGRLVPKKGFDVLVDALVRVELEGVDVQLTLLGEGPERAALARRIAKLKLGSRVSMPGVVLDAELKKHFDSADAFVMPSIELPHGAGGDGDQDGLPNVVLEAFALGLPVIGTEAGSLRDVLNVETGFVPEPGLSNRVNSRTLALAIREMALEPEQARKRANAARTVIEKRYDIRKNIEPLFKELTTP